MPEPTPEHLARQLVRLAHATFDMRSALAVAERLIDEQHHANVGALTYGLLTGLAVTYARPFLESRELGRLESKWSEFPGRADLKKKHDRLIELRKTLLAHTDETSHRRVAVFTRGAVGDQPAVTEGRSPINVPGIVHVVELVTFQEERFNNALVELAERLHDISKWPDAELIELQASGEFEVLDAPSQSFVDSSDNDVWPAD